MQKLILTILVVALILPVFAWSDEDTKSVEETVEKTVAAHNHPTAVELRIRVKNISVSGEYASVAVSSPNREGETEVAYLQKIERKWVVLDQGTGVNTHEIGIPDDILWREPSDISGNDGGLIVSPSKGPGGH